MCDENVLRLASIDCSSPMSANTRAENRQPRALRRHVQAGLRHQRKQSRGLQRHRLAAGVGSRDQQHPVGRVQQHVDRHRLLEHRVPRLFQLQAGVDRELRLDGVELRAVAGLGLQHVEVTRDVPATSCRAGRARKRSVSSSRMRKISSRSRSSSSTMSLLISTVAAGSMNNVAPVVSCRGRYRARCRDVRREPSARSGRCAR